MVNEFHDFTAHDGFAVEAAWMYYLLDANTAKEWIHEKMGWAADGVDIDSEEVASHDHDACRHGDLFPSPWLGMVVREMDLLGEEAMDSVVDLEWESGPQSNANPV